MNIFSKILRFFGINRRKTSEEYLEPKSQAQTVIYKPVYDMTVEEKRALYNRLGMKGYCERIRNDVRMSSGPPIAGSAMEQAEAEFARDAKTK